MTLPWGMSIPRDVQKPVWILLHRLVGLVLCSFPVSPPDWSFPQCMLDKRPPFGLGKTHDFCHVFIFCLADIKSTWKNLKHQGDVSHSGLLQLPVSLPSLYLPSPLCFLLLCFYAWDTHQFSSCHLELMVLGYSSRRSLSHSHYSIWLYMIICFTDASLTSVQTLNFTHVQSVMPQVMGYWMSLLQYLSLV